MNKLPEGFSFPIQDINLININTGIRCPFSYLYIMTISESIKNADWDSLVRLLDKLSNSEFRRMETHIRDTVLPTLSNDAFWEAYLHLLMYRRQAFLTCILAIKNIAKDGTLNFEAESARKTAVWLEANASDSNAKVIRMALPLLQSVEQIDGLFAAFKVEKDSDYINLLLSQTSLPIYYVLFQKLRLIDDDRQLLRTTLLALMKKNDELSWGMASLIKAYFGIDDIKSTFALQIEPFELSYADKSYDNFAHIVKGKPIKQ